MDLSAVTVQTFSGGAGCGKTFRLMQALSEYLIATPLREGQKVLALTFMHGSRCPRRPNFDHPCRLNIDQEWKAARRAAFCG